MVIQTVQNVMQNPAFRSKCKKYTRFHLDCNNELQYDCTTFFCIPKNVKHVSLFWIIKKFKQNVTNITL